MVNRVYRTSSGHRRRRKSVPRFVSTFFVLVFFVAGSVFVGVKWMHGHSGNSQTDTTTLAAADGSADTTTDPSTSMIVNALVPEDAHAAEVLPARANFVSAFDGQVTGVANRVDDGSGNSANYHLLVYLPGLDPVQETYAVWLLKDGLADVKRMGELSARADGSWALDFTSGPMSGIASPDAYRTVVIMKEPKGSSNTPSGTKMATASF